MGFYYFSILGTALALIVGICAAGAFWLVWRGVLRLRISAWAFMLSLPAFLLLPWLEEFWIAYHFNKLCRRDAGLSVSKTVEAPGYFDATAGLLQVNNPVLAVTAKDFDRRGFKYYEMSLANTRERSGKVAHFEKVNGSWIGTVLDRPMARYHYTSDLYGEKVVHKIVRVESRVTDTSQGEIIGRYVSYGRGPSWIYIGLGEPPYSCDGPEGGPNSRHSRLIYRDLLRPAK